MFGESSGGLNVFSHLISPQSAGLYGGAIIQRGAYQPNTASLRASENLGVTFASAVGCAGQTAACLRAISVADIVANGANPFKQSTVEHLRGGRRHRDSELDSESEAGLSVGRRPPLAQTGSGSDTPKEGGS
jgi:carboxylesterase type B